ncbi:MAG: hypothetical protein F7C35_00550 [Desulfurococcales archaeon]|nr:hypothetical protein [Desulfurococcales archaeon]
MPRKSKRKTRTSKAKGAGKRKTTVEKKEEPKTKREPKEKVKAPVVKVKVRWFKRARVKVSGVELDVLKPVKEIEREEVGAPLDVLMRVAEELSTTGGGTFEVEVEGGVRRVFGEEKAPEPSDSEVSMLFPRPARLKSIAVVRFNALEEASEGGVSVFAVKEDKLRFAKVKSELYVYEGRIKAPDDVYLIVLDTDLGRRLVRVPREPIISKLVRPSQPLPGLDGESRSNEHEQGEDNTPSS